MDLSKLSKPFEQNDIKFRAGATNQDKSQALALPYITSRAVMDRLDSVVGPANWQDEYRPGPDGGVLCGISILVDNGWITKFDGADNTNIEAVKGGLSDAFKRSAVKWGIGRYLRSLPAIWVRTIPAGKSIRIDEGEARQKCFGKQRGGANGNGSNRQKYIDRINVLITEIEDNGGRVLVPQDDLKKSSLEELIKFGKELKARLEKTE